MLGTVGSTAVETLFYKHFGTGAIDNVVYFLASAEPDGLRALVGELLTHNGPVRVHAPVKHVFDTAVGELERWVLHDGWIVEEGSLVRVTPAAEEATGVRDKFLEDVGSSGLDEQGEIKRAVEDSSTAFVSEPPDYNGSITKIRIALETVVRRAASDVAARRGLEYPEDSWGRALGLLRAAGVMETKEEQMLARVYTFISPAAHIPSGVTDEEWARLARTFGLSSAYFILRKYVSA